MARAFLSVVIPYYQEPEALLQFAVHGVAMQLGVDFNEVEVILVNDGNPESTVSDEFVTRWPMLNIQRLQCPKNVGAGLCRQYAFDLLDSEYVMFLDADDRWQNVGFLSAVLQAVKENPPDFLWSHWIEDFSTPQSGFQSKPWQKPNTWLHGKAYNVDFLRQADIRFHPKLRVHEDEYFHQLVMRTASKIAELPIVGHVWVNNPDSTVRRNNREFYASTSAVDVLCYVYVCEWLEAHGLDASAMACDMIAHFYVFLARAYMRNFPDDVAAAEKLITEQAAKYWGAGCNKAPHGWLGGVINRYRDEYYQNGEIEEETFFAWLDRLGLKRPEVI